MLSHEPQAFPPPRPRREAAGAPAQWSQARRLASKDCLRQLDACISPHLAVSPAAVKLYRGTYGLACRPIGAVICASGSWCWPGQQCRQNSDKALGYDCFAPRGQGVKCGDGYCAPRCLMHHMSGGSHGVLPRSTNGSHPLNTDRKSGSAITRAWPRVVLRERRASGGGSPWRRSELTPKRPAYSMGAARKSLYEATRLP